MNIRIVVASSAALLLRIFALILFGRAAHLFIVCLFAVSQIHGIAVPESILRLFLLSALEAAAIWFGARPVGQMLVARLSFGVAEDQPAEESAPMREPGAQSG